MRVKTRPHLPTEKRREIWGTGRCPAFWPPVFLRVGPHCRLLRSPPVRFSRDDKRGGRMTTSTHLDLVFTPSILKPPNYMQGLILLRGMRPEWYGGALRPHHVQRLFRITAKTYSVASSPSVLSHSAWSRVRVLRCPAVLGSVEPFHWRLLPCLALVVRTGKLPGTGRDLPALY